MAKTKVKVNMLLIKLKKYGALFPVLFILPYFAYNPSIAKIHFLMIMIVYYYVLFMGPVKFIEFLIPKLDLKQKVVDVLSWSCGLIMYCWTFYNWIFVFMKKSDYDFASAIFIIPFIAFLRCVQVILFTIICVYCYNYLSTKLKKKEG